jgi:hypothetical protein
MKKLIFLLTLFLSIKSFAAGICDDQSLLDNLWNKKYQQLVLSPDASDINNPHSHTYKIAKALCFLEISGWSKDRSFFHYFNEFVSRTLVNLVSTSSAFAETKSATNEIEIYPPYFDEDPIMEYKRASALVHEARHLEMIAKNIPNNDHVICHNGGNLDGKRNCDEIFVADWDVAGATSFEVMFFRNLYDSPSLKFNKEYLKTWIIYLLNNSFNVVTPELREQFTKD